MTPEQTLAHRLNAARQAESAWEVVQPILDEIDAEYTARMVEVANTELSRDKRADKLTALSNALKISANLRSGLQAAMMDGEVAQRDKLRADRIEKLTAPQRRLLKLGTGY